MWLLKYSQYIKVCYELNEEKILIENKEYLNIPVYYAEDSKVWKAFTYEGLNGDILYGINIEEIELIFGYLLLDDMIDIINNYLYPIKSYGKHHVISIYCKKNYNLDYIRKFNSYSLLSACENNAEKWIMNILEYNNKKEDNKKRVKSYKKKLIIDNSIILMGKEIKLEEFSIKKIKVDILNRCLLKLVDNDKLNIDLIKKIILYNHHNYNYVLDGFILVKILSRTNDFNLYLDDYDRWGYYIYKKYSEIYLYRKEICKKNIDINNEEIIDFIIWCLHYKLCNNWLFNNYILHYLFIYSLKYNSIRLYDELKDSNRCFCFRVHPEIYINSYEIDSIIHSNTYIYNIIDNTTKELIWSILYNNLELFKYIWCNNIDKIKYFDIKIYNLIVETLNSILEKKSIYYDIRRWFRCGNPIIN